MNTIKPSQIQNIASIETHSIMTAKMLKGTKITVDTSEPCYTSIIEKKENTPEILTFEATEKYLTVEPFETRTIKFLDFVSTATKKNIINLPSSKHHGKSREEYIEEDQFLTISRKEGNMDEMIRTRLSRGEDDLIDDTCTHGTNLYSFLIAAKTSDGYLLPLNKQIKRFGLAQTGESKGKTSLNRKYVSSIGLKFYKSCFEDALDYAELVSKSTCFSSPKLFASQILNDDCPESILKTYEALSAIPVVIIGYGRSRGFTKSYISHEHGYKRIKVRTVAVPNEKIKQDLESLLPKINPNRLFKVVLSSDIKRIDEENPWTERRSHDDKPDYIKLGIIDADD